MNREEIMRIIPHRPPMLLVDEAEKKDENSCRGSYTVKGDEWFLQGHFPGKPTVPGVVLCEMMGQALSLIHIFSKPCLPAEKSAVKPFPFGGFIRFVSALLRKDYQFIWRRL